MTAADLTERLQSLRDLLTATANVSKAEEYLLEAHQGLLLSLLRDASEGGISRLAALNAASPNVQLLIDLSERDQITVSIELLELIDEMTNVGLMLRRPALSVPVKPLASFARQPGTVHTVFVDEAGTPSFDEHNQPVLSLVGVVVEDEAISTFDTETVALLSRYGLPASVEIHAHQCIKGEDEFAAIAEPDRRFQLLREFTLLGATHVVGVHYMSMLKPMVKDEIKQQLKDLKLDAYTSLVIWFNVTLNIGIVPLIGLRPYRYLFDRTDSYKRKIVKIVRALKASGNPKLRILGVDGDPIAVDSRAHRFVATRRHTGILFDALPAIRGNHVCPAPEPSEVRTACTRGL